MFDEQYNYITEDTVSGVEVNGYYTKDEVDTTSGTLQTEIDSKPDTLLELTDTPSAYDNSKYLQSTAAGTFWAAVAGIAGPKGEDGGEWVGGYGAPTASTGTLNNFYLDYNNGDIYRKEATVTGTQYGVMIAREASGSYTFADAVRFVKTGHEVIVDNMDDEASFTGTWSTYNTANAYNGNCRYATNDYTAQANFEFVVPDNGDYDVYAYWPALGTACPDAPFMITHASGTTTIRKSQTINGSTWNYLSTHEFDGAAIWVWKMNIQGSTTFSGLSDTPATYDNGKYLRSTAVGTEWYDLNDGYVTLDTDQTISGTKTFDNTIYFNANVSGTGDIYAGDLIRIDDTNASIANREWLQVYNSVGNKRFEVGSIANGNPEVRLLDAGGTNTRIGFPASDPTYFAFINDYTEMWLGISTDQILYFNYYNGTGEEHGTTTNRQEVNYYVGTGATGFNIDGDFTLDGGDTVNIIRDEDDFGHDDPNALITQQSAKAYVDAKPDTLLELTDTPSSYSNNDYLRSTTSGAEWADVNQIIQCYNNTTTDLNVVTPVAVPWNGEDFKDSLFTHSTVTNNSRVQVTASGIYEISYNISLDNASTSRNTVRTRVRVNGATYINRGTATSYSRNTTDDKQTNSMTFIWELSTNDYIEIMGDRQGSAGGGNTMTNESHIYMKLIRYT